jgi:hypothetical protein
MKNYLVLFLFFVLVVNVTGPLSATPLITGTSSSTFIDNGQYSGLYRYDVSISWKGRRNLDEIIILLNNNLDESQQFLFPEPAGSSTAYRSPGILTTWTGTFVDNQNSKLFNGKEYIQFAASILPAKGRLGRGGFGTFTFYSDLAPDFGLHDNILVEYGGHGQKNYGDVSGALPSVQIIPEPATIALIGIGGFMLFFRKKR